MTPALVEIVTTVGTEEDARRISREVVTSGLVACATFSRVQSVFSWKGALCDETEFQIVFKTLVTRAAEAEEAIRSLHPYETPGILRVPVVAANADYAAWVEESVRERGGR